MSLFKVWLRKDGTNNEEEKESDEKPQVGITFENIHTWAWTKDMGGGGLKEFILGGGSNKIAKSFLQICENLKSCPKKLLKLHFFVQKINFFC